MKERFKKFYKNHEDQFAIATFFAGTASVIAGVYLLHKDKERTIAGVFSGNDVPPGSTIFVTLKNGHVLPFTKPTKK